MKSSEGFCSFKGPFFPVFYRRECLGCAGQEGMVAGDEHKRQQKGSLFMTLTLIVAGPAMPAVPRFPRICHQRNDISHTCWEGDPTSGWDHLVCFSPLGCFSPPGFTGGFPSLGQRKNELENCGSPSCPPATAPVALALWEPS